ncbi:MAG TPA: cupin domain-containing protein [Kiloniellales bacterium]|nr:cupin domain-containing protein [Kiloniellales bacterium]
MNQSARQIVSKASLQLRPYDRYGKVIEGLEWHPVSDNKETGEASFFLKFAPGAASQPHEHVRREEFLVLEGSLVEPDGTVLRPGDFVSFPPGSRHHSHSPDGCLLLVFLRGYNRRLAPGEREEDAA